MKKLNEGTLTAFLLEKGKIKKDITVTEIWLYLNGFIEVEYTEYPPFEEYLRYKEDTPKYFLDWSDYRQSEKYTRVQLLPKAIAEEVLKTFDCSDYLKEAEYNGDFIN